MTESRVAESLMPSVARRSAVIHSGRRPTNATLKNANSLSFPVHLKQAYVNRVMNDLIKFKRGITTCFLRAPAPKSEDQIIRSGSFSLLAIFLMACGVRRKRLDTVCTLLPCRIRDRNCSISS